MRQNVGVTLYHQPLYSQSFSNCTDVYIEGRLLFFTDTSKKNHIFNGQWEVIDDRS